MEPQSSTIPKELIAKLPKIIGFCFFFLNDTSCQPSKLHALGVVVGALPVSVTHGWPAISYIPGGPRISTLDSDYDPPVKQEAAIDCRSIECL